MKRSQAGGRALLYSLYHMLWQGVDLLLPPTCAGCGRRGHRWCPDCRKAVQPLPTPLCVRCGRCLQGAQDICGGCRSDPPRFSQLRSWAVFAQPIRPALHRLKYRRDLGLAEAIVPQLAAFTGGLEWCVDLLVPVPLGRDRLRQRGYNQAGLISWPLSLALDIRHAPQALRRTRDTASQVGLSRHQRHENVRSAFASQPKWVDGRSVLVLDDVATTGATLSSCAEALFAAGARDVFALTVARAMRGSGDGERVESDEMGSRSYPL